MPDIEYRFGTGHGDPHVHHGQENVDVNGDGTPDGIALDFDGDGRVDDVMWDSDGDGVADTVLLDGSHAKTYSDPTGQGTWNAHGQGGSGTHAAAPPQEAHPSPTPTGGTTVPTPSDTHHEDSHPTSSSGYEPYDESAHHGADHPGTDHTEHTDHTETSGGGLFDGFLDDHHQDEDTGDDPDDLYDDMLDDHHHDDHLSW